MNSYHKNTTREKMLSVDKVPRSTGTTFGSYLKPNTTGNNTRVIVAKGGTTCKNAASDKLGNPPIQNKIIT